MTPDRDAVNPGRDPGPLAKDQKLAEHARELDSTKRPQDAIDPRAKNSGHGKKTADKWNQ